MQKRQELEQVIQSLHTKMTVLEQKYHQNLPLNPVSSFKIQHDRDNQKKPIDVRRVSHQDCQFTKGKQFSDEYEDFKAFSPQRKSVQETCTFLSLSEETNIEQDKERELLQEIMKQKLELDQALTSLIKEKQRRKSPAKPVE